MAMIMTGACTHLVAMLTHNWLCCPKTAYFGCGARVPNGNVAGIPLGTRSQLHPTTELSLSPGAGKLGGGARSEKLKAQGTRKGNVGLI